MTQLSGGIAVTSDLSILMTLTCHVHAVCFRVVVQFAIPESRTATLGRLLSGRSARLTANCITTCFRSRAIHLLKLPKMYDRPPSPSKNDLDSSTGSEPRRIMRRLGLASSRARDRYVGVSNIQTGLDCECRNVDPTKFRYIARFNNTKKSAGLTLDG